MGKYEVTFEQYCASTKRPCPDSTEHSGRGNPKGWGRGKQPVINVSWEEASNYARWLSTITGQAFRLPTEAEWEYAARGGTKGRYWWCDDENPNCDVEPGMANCNGCGSRGEGKNTTPVGSFVANPFGLYDTAGNVWEFVKDCQHSNYQGAAVNGAAWNDTKANGDDCERRVICGGGWMNDRMFVRSAVGHYCGFRK